MEGNSVVIVLNDEPILRGHSETGRMCLHRVTIVLETGSDCILSEDQ